MICMIDNTGKPLPGYYRFDGADNVEVGILGHGYMSLGAGKQFHIMEGHITYHNINVYAKMLSNKQFVIVAFDANVGCIGTSVDTSNDLHGIGESDIKRLKKYLWSHPMTKHKFIKGNWKGPPESLTDVIKAYDNVYLFPEFIRNIKLEGAVQFGHNDYMLHLLRGTPIPGRPIGRFRQKGQVRIEIGAI